MKKILLSTCLVLWSLLLSAQSSFEIISIGSHYTENQIMSAFSNADFCGSFYTSKRNRIELNDGSIVELKSKNELIQSSQVVAEECFLSDDSIYYKATWSIGENGFLIKAFNTEIHSSEKEYNKINKQQ